eukprot:COSAG01_NODE_5910_length_3959_cov_2.072539_4_plen_267_part_00
MRVGHNRTRDAIVAALDMPSKGSIGDAGDVTVKGKWYPSEAARLKKLAALGPEPGRGDDPLWCVACQRRFASPGVFQGHLAGKKHIGALKRAGKHKEAAILKQRGIDAAQAAQLSKAQETATGKRLRPAVPGGIEAARVKERDRKVAKVCFEPGGAAGVAAGATPAPSGAGPTSGAVVEAAVLPANPNGLEWWKGVPADPDEGEEDNNLTALERLLQKKAGSRSEGRGAGDWKCPGNWAKKKECGAWNFRSRQTCRACGAQKRLGT